MPQKFELSLASGYVKDWNVTDAIRELFQNAKDQEATEPDNKMFFDYDFASEELTIGNKKSVLTAKTLLLGSTTKSGDDKTIGQFGEGYKIATLVLLRLGKEIRFQNYGQKELWLPRMVNSRRYGTEVLTFFVEKHVWTKVPDNNLTICVDGITPDEYEEIKLRILDLQDNVARVHTKYGDILTDENQVGRIYVNGLFVKNESLKYGYDILPQYLKLDRDRKMVATTDIVWLTGKMIADTDNIIMIKDSIQSHCADTQYANYDSVGGTIKPEVRESIYRDFTDKYGDKAIPVTNQWAAEEVQKTYGDAKTIIVSETERAMITSAPSYTIKATKSPKVSIRYRFAKWLEIYGYAISTEGTQAFNQILEDLPEDDENA